MKENNFFVCLFVSRAVEIPLAGETSFGTGTGFLSSGTCLSGISGTLKREVVNI